MDKLMPLVIAKQKDARFLKDDYKLGWLMTDEKSWYWMVWGSSSNLENAKKVAKQILDEKGEHEIFLSEQPLLKDTIQNGMPDLKNITEEIKLK